MRLVLLIPLMLICTIPEQTIACSCFGPDLQGSFESSPNVFTAVVTGAKFDNEGNIEADFEVTEMFKGEIPFDKLRTTRSGTSCDTSITVGPEYLFFMGNEGRFGGCSVRQTIVPGISMPWLDILQAHKAGETQDLSSPWDYYAHDGNCSLRTDFRVAADALRAYLNMEFRNTVPENPVGTIESRNKAGYSSAVFMLPTREEPEDAQLILITPNREFVARWSEDALPGRSRGAFKLTGDDVRLFAKELLLASEVQLEGSIARYPTLDGTVIRTTNARGAISDFINCSNK